MASVHKVKRAAAGGRGHHAWQVRYRDPDRRLRARTFTRKVEAERFAAAVETDKSRGSWTDPQKGRITVSDWSSVWLKSKVDLRPSSRARLEGIVATHIEPVFGRRTLDRVGNADVRAWVSKLSTERSAATTRKAHNALHQMFRAAVSDRRIPFDPTADVPLPAEHAHEQKFLTADQVETLANCIEPRFRAFVLLAAYGGLRFGELAGLRRKRVDVLRGRVDVSEATSDVHGYSLTFGPPKTKRSRRPVPLPRCMVSELEAHLTEYVDADADALVFTGPKGAPIRRAGFGRLWWAPATKAAGLEGLRVHELRHTFVALSIAAGCDARKVSIRAGHSSVAFTLDRYGHLFEDDETADMCRLDTLLANTRPSDPAQVLSIK